MLAGQIRGQVHIMYMLNMVHSITDKYPNTKPFGREEGPPLKRPPERRVCLVEIFPPVKHNHLMGSGHPHPKT